MVIFGLTFSRYFARYHASKTCDAVGRTRPAIPGSDHPMNMAGAFRDGLRPHVYQMPACHSTVRRYFARYWSGNQRVLLNPASDRGGQGPFPGRGRLATGIHVREIRWTTSTVRGTSSRPQPCRPQILSLR
jgi:hypothetical protein